MHALSTVALVAVVAFVSLTFYSISVFGFCWVIGASKITLPPRNLLNNLAAPTTRQKPLRVVSSFLLSLVECPACLGFWVGLVVGFQICAQLGQPRLLAIALGFYTTGVNFLLGRATGLIEHP